MSSSHQQAATDVGVNGGPLCLRATRSPRVLSRQRSSHYQTVVASPHRAFLVVCSGDASHWRYFGGRDPYFGPMFAKRVEFYRSGSFHLNANALLRHLRAERIRRTIQQAAVEENLAEGVDDFDDLPGDEYEDEDSDAY
jgi:hypothetical protein